MLSLALGNDSFGYLGSCHFQICICCLYIFLAFIVLVIITWALYSKFGAVYVSTSGLA